MAIYLQNYRKEVDILKKQVKKYIDTADEKVVMMAHAMLEVNTQNDGWDDLSGEIQWFVNDSAGQEQP